MTQTINDLIEFFESCVHVCVGACVGVRARVFVCVCVCVCLGVWVYIYIYMNVPFPQQFMRSFLFPVVMILIY